MGLLEIAIGFRSALYVYRKSFEELSVADLVIYWINYPLY